MTSRQVVFSNSIHDLILISPGFNLILSSSRFRDRAGDVASHVTTEIRAKSNSWKEKIVEMKQKQTG